MTEMSNLTKKEKRVSKALFGAIAIMLLPFILSNIVLGNSEYTLPLMLIAYAVQLGILMSAFWRYYRGISKDAVLLLVWLIFFQISTFVVDWHMTFYISLQDVAGAFAKCVNFIILYGVMKNVQLKKAQIIRFMEYFVCFSVFACIYNLLAYWPDVMRFATIQNTYELNLQSFFTNRNQFGTFLFVSLVAHSYVVTEKGMKIRNVMIYVIQILSILLTMSRGAILVSVLFMGLLILKNIKRKSNLLFVIVSIFFGSLVLIYILTRADIVEYISRIFLRTGEGATGRNSIWNMGISTWQHNIFSGVGFYSGVEWAKTQGFQYGQFHSMIIDILVSGGLAELAFIAIVFATVINRCKKRCIDKNIKEIYFISLFSVFVLSLVESVNFFSIGYADSLWTISFVTVPLLLANMRPDEERYSKG